MLLPTQSGNFLPSDSPVSLTNHIALTTGRRMLSRWQDISSFKCSYLALFTSQQRRPTWPWWVQQCHCQLAKLRTFTHCLVEFNTFAPIQRSIACSTLAAWYTIENLNYCAAVLDYLGLSLLLNTEKTGGIFCRVVGRPAAKMHLDSGKPMAPITVHGRFVYCRRRRHAAS